MTEQEPATEKQVKFMKQLGVKDPETFSKIGARGAIELKLREQEGNGDKPEVNQEKEWVKPISAVKEFHLSPEQVRTNALNSSLEYCKRGPELRIDMILNVAKQFEKYLWGN